MNKPSIRLKVLVGSVEKLLDADEQVHDVVVLWTRHRWYLPYWLFTAAFMYAVATLSGIETTANRVVVVGCGLAIAAMASTNYWILSDTSKGLVLLRSSRIRHYAKKVERRLDADPAIEMTNSTVITSDWRIDGLIYTVTKRWEATMREIATR